MADAMWDVIYLDWERIGSMAGELGTNLTRVSQAASMDKSHAPSRGSQTTVLHALVQSLADARAFTDISASFDFAQWLPGSFKDGQLLRISTAPGSGSAGFVRFLDYPWLSSMMETLPRTLKVSQRAELSALKQKRESRQITQEQVEQKVKEHQAQLKDLDAWKMDELTEVIRELFGASVRLKIVPGGATRGEMFVAACPQMHFLEPPALLSQRYGCDIDAPWSILGLVNAPAANAQAQPMPTGNAVEDMFERLALAVNRIHRVASPPDFPALSLTPLAIWRELEIKDRTRAAAAE